MVRGLEGRKWELRRGNEKQVLRLRFRGMMERGEFGIRKSAISSTPSLPYLITGAESSFSSVVDLWLRREGAVDGEAPNLSQLEWIENSQRLI